MGRLRRWTLRFVAQVRRQYLSRLRPGYVRRARELRRGECRCCGTCCSLTFHCPLLDESNRCKYYQWRNVSCRDFPHDATDLRLTQVPCGHYFEEPAEDGDVRIPLTKYGLRELVLFGGLSVAGIVLAAVFLWYLVPLFALTLLFVLYFFRDPERKVPATPRILVSPADGRVADVMEVEEKEFLRRKTVRIGIFMSPLNVHVNRFPCQGRVEAVVHRPGQFLAAMNPEASSVNESNAIAIRAEEGVDTQILVRQISGVLARRIVCQVAEGESRRRGERFGMVKFGSRAEVYVPLEAGFELSVKVGQRVRAGETVLGKFKE
jgi:phosphatidylserine decarboxylase